MKSGDVIRKLEKAGWKLDRVNGSHHTFKPPGRCRHRNGASSKEGFGQGLGSSDRANLGRKFERRLVMGLLLYPAVVERTGEGFAVFFPGLACGGAGESMAAAVADAEQGLAAYLDAARENGIDVPPPAEIDKIKVESDIDEVARILVRYEPPAHSVRLNITMDEALLKRVDAVAEREGFTRSGFLANAARRCLVEHARGYDVTTARKGAPSATVGSGARTGACKPVGRQTAKSRHSAATAPKSKKKR